MYEDIGCVFINFNLNGHWNIIEELLLYKNTNDERHQKKQANIIKYCTL